MKQSDREAVRRVLAGNKDAYGSLIDSYQGMVFATALNLTGNYTDSEDIAQEVFLIAYRRLRSLTDPSKFGAWLHTIARHVALQFLRNKRHLRLTAFETLERNKTVADVESPLEAYARREISAILWQEVAQLPTKTREAVLLYYMEGFTFRRAAAFLGINENAMKARLDFGREKLRAGVTRRIESELRQHQPSKKTRKAVLALLPNGGVPPLGLVGARGVETGLSLFAFSAKHGAIVGAVIVACLLATLALYGRFTQAPSPTPLPLHAGQDDRDYETKASSAESEADVAPLAIVGGHAIRGHVLQKEDRAPVVGMPVFLRAAAGGAMKTRSGRSGAFAFDGLADGDYEVYLDSQDDAFKTKYHASRSHASIRVRVSGADAEDLAFLLSQGARISGSVVDQRNRGVKGADLVLRPLGRGLERIATRSGTAGAFEFTGLSTKVEYDLHCTAKGYAPSSLQNLRTYTDKPLDGLVIRLIEGSGATLSGRVINQDRRQVPGAALTLWGREGQLGAATTDAYGIFTFSDIRPGRANLMSNLYNKNLRFDIQPNAVIDDIEIIVYQELFSGYVAGRIRNGAGEPITDGMVFAHTAGQSRASNRQWSKRYDSGDDLSEAVPDTDGNFHLANLRPGTSVDIVYMGTSGPRQATSAANVRVPSRGIDVVFVSTEPDIPVIAVHGRILDSATLTPIQQFVTCISTTADTLTAKPVRYYDRDGQFSIANVHFFPWRTFLYVVAQGYNEEYRPVQAPPGARKVYLEMRLSKGAGSISGRVVDMGDMPVRGARVSLSSSNEEYATTDARGRFTLENVQNRARNLLLVNHPAYAPFRSDTFATQGNTDIHDYVVRLGVGATITGVVLADSREPVADSQIRIVLGHNMQQVAALLTDPMGVYKIEHLPDAAYTVECTERGERQQVTVADGQVVRVDFGGERPTLSGTISWGGEPVQAARVVACDFPHGYRGGAYFLESSTDSDGNYVLAGVPPGACYLLVFEGHVRRGTLLVDVDGTKDEVYDIRIGPLGTIAGQVIARNTEPLAGVIVKLIDSTGGRTFGRTDDRGNYVIDEVASGEYVLEALHKGNAVSTDEFHIDPGQVLEGITLTVP